MSNKNLSKLAEMLSAELKKSNQQEVENKTDTPAIVNVAQIHL
jgi:hypothetical protein